MGPGVVVRDSAQDWSARTLEKHLNNSILLTHQMWPDFERWLVEWGLGRAENRGDGTSRRGCPQFAIQELAFLTETWPILGILGQLLCVGTPAGISSWLARWCLSSDATQRCPARDLKVAGTQSRNWDLLPHLLGSGSHGTDPELRAPRSPTKVTTLPATRSLGRA